MSYAAINSSASVAVVGAGSMGAGIAQLAAQAGHAVHLHDTSEGAAAAAIGRIAADLASQAQRGRITDAQRDRVMERLHPCGSMDGLRGCALVVEAIVERLDAKQGLFRQLEALLPADAVLATNTSSMSVTAIANGLKHPGRVVGWHFFNPATRMRLVEIVPGVETDPALVEAMHSLSRAWGKTPVNAPNTPGFIVNRVARPYYAEGLRLLSERIAPAAAIDRILRKAGGFAMGPFELMDLIGIDVNLSVTESVFHGAFYDGRYAPHVIQQELVRSGRFGRKTGRGFYDHGPGAAEAAVDAVPPADGATPPLRASASAGLLQPLLTRLRNAGVAVAMEEGLPDETMFLGDAAIALTDGRTAAERAFPDPRQAVLLLDLAHDYATTGIVAAASNAAGKAHLPHLASLLKAVDAELVAVEDVAGLIVMRTVCCLANEAADVSVWSNVPPIEIDTAMKLGTNYPLGPLAWADLIGNSRVARVLENLQRHYGDARYRRSPALSRAHFEGRGFHG
jgi:3-hydroxybutyryl-CoA dehydrogenase